MSAEEQFLTYRDDQHVRRLSLTGLAFVSFVRYQAFDGKEGPSLHHKHCHPFLPTPNSEEAKILQEIAETPKSGNVIPLFEVDPERATAGAAS